MDAGELDRLDPVVSEEESDESGGDPGCLGYTFLWFVGLPRVGAVLLLSPLPRPLLRPLVLPLVGATGGPSWDACWFATSTSLLLGWAGVTGLPVACGPRPI